MKFPISAATTLLLTLSALAVDGPGRTHDPSSLARCDSRLDGRSDGRHRLRASIDTGAQPSDAKDEASRTPPSGQEAGLGDARNPALEGSDGDATPGAKKPEQTIRDAFQEAFFIGAAGDIPGRYSDEELQLAKTHFNFWTPENCMKPAPVHPREDEWRLERPDALVEWCVANQIRIHGHTLVWHAQTNDWFYREGDKALATERMRQHIHTLVGRYRGKIHSWDVVNEAIDDRGDAGTENLRNSGWLEAIGPEFVLLAFKFAHEADPDAVLYYNDYGIELGDKHQSSMLLLKRLIDDGAPIHGVGIQGHWSTTSVPFEDIDKAIADYASLGLKVSITELDVTIRGAAGGQFRRRAGRRRPIAPPSKEDLRSQAEAYAKLFAIFKKHEKDIERVTFWGLHDSRTWRFGQHPLLFDGERRRKPAYDAILGVATGSGSQDIKERD